MSKNGQLNWMKFNVYDFMHSEDVEAMSDAEVGQYCLLLFSAWCGGKDCTLPNNLDYLARKARCERVSSNVISKFEQDGNGRLFNRVQLEVWNEQQAKLASYSERGKKGNDRRWGGDISGVAEGSLKDRYSIAEGLEGKGKEG